MLIYELSNDIMQREIQQEFTEMKVSKNNFCFFKHFLNMDISAAVALSCSKFEMCIHEIHMEGSVSQNFDIWIVFPCFQHVSDWVYWYYMVELGFYLSLIISLFMDERRKVGLQED